MSCDWIRIDAEQCEIDSRTSCFIRITPFETVEFNEITEATIFKLGQRFEEADLWFSHRYVLYTDALSIKK